mmetsp:Transcript_5442/g.10843  ORF Transcript_5442/g.10843 Transcript_5442/m.10843 type:complete len:90 (-) Transcript_5442:11-280(-)
MNNRDKPGPSSSSPAAFHPALVRKLVSMHLDEQSDKTAPPTLTSEAADAVGELLKIFVLEARNRAALDAEIERGVEEGDTLQIQADNII